MMEIWNLQDALAFTGLHKSERDHNDSQGKQYLKEYNVPAAF